jgi:PAS domain S-box-containing protein
MLDDSTTLTGPAALVSRFRRTALRHTVDLLGNPNLATDARQQAEAFPRVAAALASSLEELRVIEEELLDRHAQYEAEQAQTQQRIDYERRLFDLAPTALLVTDINGAVIDANRAACTLLGADTSTIDRKPLITFVPQEERSTFRSELARLGVTQGVADWRFKIARRRDVPVTVSAAVHLVARANRRCGGPGLFWCLRVLSQEHEPPVHPGMQNGSH